MGHTSRGDISLDYLYSSPSPRAASLSTPPLTSTFPSPLQKLIDAIDTSNLHIPSFSQQHITESSLQQVTRASLGIIAIPQADEATPPMSKKTQVGISSGVATTTVETMVSQLDNGYIIKTPLKAKTVETIVSTSVGSPQYHEQRALGLKPSLTTSGGNSDDLVNSSDGLNYQEMTEMVTNLEPSVGEMKDMMKILIQNSRPRSSNVDIAKEIWVHV
ncbi:hypothetical protein Hanom_Chr07g00601431 [Helianthus anomalus]